MKPLAFICCGVLRREIMEILRQDHPEAEQIFLESMLHMHPEMLREAIDEVMTPRGDRPCLLVYGDCHAHIQETGKQPNCAKTEAINCGDLLLGRELYRTYRNEKAFLFLPEWTERWREVFQTEMGFLDQELARDFMQENQSKLIYLDTGIVPVPRETLDEISEYFSMPIEVITVTLDHLRQKVRVAVQRLEEKATDEC